MTQPSGENIEHDAIHAAAADWFSRMQQRDVSLEQTLDWQRWMSADARHGAAFQRIEEVWRAFAKLTPPPLLADAELDSDPYAGEIAVGDYLFQNGSKPDRAAPQPLTQSFQKTPQGFPAAVVKTKTRRFAARRWAIAASIAVTCGLLVSLYVTDTSLPLPHITQTIETAIGENRTVRLTDGSRVTLGGHTRLEIGMTDKARALRLSRGEAFFIVAKDSARPFSVRAGTATVTALGTEFNLRRGENRVAIAVVQGRVLVAPATSVLRKLSWLQPAATERQPKRLDAGSQITVDELGFKASASLSDASLATAWQSGRMAFEREPLRYVLEDVNRYSRKPIVLSNSEIGDLQITGTISNDNIAGWIASLESAFGLRATEESDRIVLTPVD